MTTASPLSEASQTSFSASDFADLPEATPSVDLPPAPEESGDTRPDTKYCPTCDKPIIREPGSRGRMPKFHPECRPSTLNRVTGGTSRVSKTRSGKAAAEADECVALFKSGMVKAAMGIAMVDRYDGFVIMSALPEACTNLHGVLMAHEKFRKDILAMRTGGSLFGLFLSFLMMGAPIAAHHGLIPSSKVAELLVNVPVTMYKIRKQMAEGEAALTTMMAEAANGVVPREASPKREA